MSRYVFDLECDGFLDEATRIHCLALKDIDNPSGETIGLRPSEVESGVRMLMEADLLIGHNVIKFDIEVIKKIYPWFTIDPTKVRDTLVLSRLIYADLGDVDTDDKNRTFTKPEAKLTGSHGLKGWGQRLDLHKGDYTGGFDEFSQEMLDYNIQDVEVTDKLWKILDAKGTSQTAIELEHQVAFIIAAQERHGIYFDIEKAKKLTATLQKRRLELEAELETTFKPWFKPGDVVVPKVPNKERGTWGWYEDTGEKLKSGKPKLKFHGYPYSEVKLTIFNPGSRHHIADRLKALYNWKPKEFTETGQPKIDEKVLGTLSWPEAKILADYFTVQKRLSALAEADGSWLNLVKKDSRIHGEIITNGAVTGRATHVRPNMSAIPAVDKPYGPECRDAFCVPKGKKQVGIDVSALEMVMLSHFLYPMDNGAYMAVATSDDPHTANQKLANIPTRKGAKTAYYAVVYGSGDLTLGSGIEPNSKPARQKALGAETRKAFVKGIPGLEKLITNVKGAAKRGYLVGLDGRHLKVRSDHAALNTLLQSGGALVCKRWMVEMDQEIEKRGYRGRVQQILWSHDELGFECDPELAEEVAEFGVDCIRRAGEFFNLRVPVTGEAKIGLSWKDCH